MSASVVPERLRWCSWERPMSPDMTFYVDHSQYASRLLANPRPQSDTPALPHRSIEVSASDVPERCVTVMCRVVMCVTVMCCDVML